MSAPAQLPLALGLRDGLSFASFLTGANGEAVAALRALSGGGEPWLVYLAGPPGSGKSHLLQAACRAADERGLRPLYLPLGQHREWPPEALEGLEGFDLICLDELEAIAGEPEWEEALFDLFNRLRDVGGRLAVAAAGRPGEIGLRLPDLVSRLGWGLSYRLHPPDDEGRLAALALRAELRGFRLPDEVGRYLLKRCPRDLPSLFRLLDRLDAATLSAKRRLTVPFVRQVLGDDPENRPPENRTPENGP